MKSYFLLFTFLFLSFFAEAQETFPISPIGPQRVFPGAKIMTSLSAVNHDLPSIHLSAIDLPNFGSFQDHGKGFGTFTFEPDSSDIGRYIVSLQAVSGADTSRTTFLVEVPSIPVAYKYYVDPINGNNNNPGSADQPWKTLSEVFSSGKTIPSNSIIFLRSGNHGQPVINKLQTATTYIVAEKGETPMFEKLNFYLAKNWVLSGIKISPEADSTSFKGNYLRIQPNCSNITIENCEIYGTSDVMNWPTNQDWYDHAGDGVLISGKNDIFRNNYIYNVYFGLTVDSPNNEVSYNLLNNFGGDGFRGIASDCQFLYNRIQNALVDDYATGNHDDGFQSWTFGAPIKNVVLKGNQIFSHTDPSLPLKTSILQGLVNFDGYSERWIVEDNLVLTDHPHGITLLGAKNCRVTNNTVINNPLHLFSYGNPPWIWIGSHKNGGGSFGNLNRNNLMAFNYQDGDPGSFDHNLIANNDDYFVNYAHWNFHLKPGSAPINAGTFTDASTLDNSHRIRLDSIPDIGAYEFGDRPYDFEKPSAVTGIQTLDIQPTSVSISWLPSTDNYIIKRYHIQIPPSGKIITDSLKAQILGLSPSQNYNLILQAEDYAGNLSEKTIFNFTTPDFPNDSLVITVPAAPADQFIKSNKAFMWVDLKNHQIGGYTNFYDACAAIPFKLPEAPSGYKLKKAKFTVHLNRIVNNPFGNGDLYALGIRFYPSISGNDYWQGKFGENTSGTALEDDFLSPTKNLGSIATADSTSTKLSDYINNSGDYANKFLILRVNSDRDDASNYRFYQFASANHEDTEARPRLDLLYTKVVPTKDIKTQAQLQIYPNPVGDQAITITWPQNTFDGSATLTISNQLGQIILKQNIPAGTNQTLLEANALPKEGAYFLTINDLKTYLVTKVVRE